MTPLPGAAQLFTLDPAIAHLNHGSFGAVPLVVRQARARLMAAYDANPTKFVSERLIELTAVARDRYAAFIGADPQGCALVANATAGTAIVLNSLDFAPGDEIVITDHSYNAVTLAVNDVAARLGVNVITAPVGLGSADDATVGAIVSAATERTRLVIVDQVSSATAQRHPVGAIATALRARGIPLLVDAAHSPGMIPAPLSGVDADFWVGNLHKWAFAAGGTALLVVSPAWRDRLRPLVVSHHHHDGFPLNIERQATTDFTVWLAGVEGLTIFRTFGAEAIWRHNVTLAAYGQKTVAKALGVPDELLPHPGANVSMRLVPLPPGTADTYPQASALRTRISDELATEVNVMPFRDRGYLRLSAQIYNTVDDFARLASGLPALLKEAA